MSPKETANEFFDRIYKEMLGSGYSGNESVESFVDYLMAELDNKPLRQRLLDAVIERDAKIREAWNTRAPYSLVLLARCKPWLEWIKMNADCYNIYVTRDDRNELDALLSKITQVNEMYLR